MKNCITDTTLEFNYFYNLNFERGSKSNKLFSNDLTNMA